jgi:hypothetical protein
MQPHYLKTTSIGQHSKNNVHTSTNTTEEEQPQNFKTTRQHRMGRKENTTSQQDRPPIKE